MKDSSWARVRGHLFPECDWKTERRRNESDEGTNELGKEQAGKRFLISHGELYKFELDGGY